MQNRPLEDDMSDIHISQNPKFEPLLLRADELNAEFNRLLDHEYGTEESDSFIRKSQILVEDLNTELAETRKHRSEPSPDRS